MQMKSQRCLLLIMTILKVEMFNSLLKPYSPFLFDKLFDKFCLFADEGSRGELHEMLVPALLKESWTTSENWIDLHSYYLEFCPVPRDRTYKKFGLFVKAPLPQEAEQLQLDLHLARGRYVTTKLVPLGLVKFNTDEVNFDSLVNS